MGSLHLPSSTKGLSNKWSKYVDQSSQSHNKSLVQKSSDVKSKATLIKRDEKSFIPSKGSLKQSIKANRSVGNFMSSEAMAKSTAFDNQQKSEHFTQINCNLRMPGKKAQCIRKVKAAFSQIIDLVNYDD